MEQLNNVLPESQEVKPADVNYVRKADSPLLNKVRQNFGIFGGISLAFGVLYALLFYKAGFGLNVTLFTTVMIILLTVMMNKLSIPMKKDTYFYYAGAFLLGVSSMLTASAELHFLNTIGTLFLLDLSILHQFHEDINWNFSKHFGKFISLPFRSIAAIGKPFMDSYYFLKNTKLIKNNRTKNIIIGVAVSLPFLWIVILLLSNADLLFQKITKSAFRFIFSPNIISVFLMIIFGFLVCYSIICGAASDSGRTEVEKSGKKADSAIAVTAMTLLCLVYALFCGIQFMYLFSNGLFTLPEGFTYAEYARRGFFELMVVTFINIILMLLCTTFFEENKALRIILIIMTACTYIMIASATYRMFLYIRAYHLTFLRLFVLLSLLIDVFVLAGIIVNIYKKSFPLFRYCVAVVSVCYIAFSFARPDYLIASYQISHDETIDGEDIVFFIRELSMDAAPVVLPLIDDYEPKSISVNRENQYTYYSLDMIENYISSYYDDINATEKDKDIRSFNYSYYKAIQYKNKYLKMNN